MPKFFFEQFGFDEKGIIKEIEYIEIKDLYENSRFFETCTYLVDLNYYRNKLLKDIKIYDDAEIIDKNGENVFVKVNNRGTLFKAKYILDFENLNTTENEIERYVEENKIYHQIRSRQFKSTDDDVRYIIKNSFVGINGEDTKDA